MRALPLLVLLLAACASDVDPPIAAEPDVDNLPAVSERASAAPQEQPSTPSALDGWQLPGSTVKLDATCENPAVPEKGAPPLCNEKGKIAIETRRTALVDSKPPCTMVSLNPQHGDAFQAETQSACIDGDHLLISTECRICRSLDAGGVYHARLSTMGPEQHAYLHQALGLKDERPTSAAAWRAFVARGKPLPKQ